MKNKMAKTENILFIGDVHIKFNNLKEVEILEKKIQTLDNLSFIVIAGDLLDTHEKINTQLLNKAYDFILTCRNKAPVYILVGNHDYINNQQFLTTNHWMNGLKEWINIYVVDKPIFVDDVNNNLEGPNSYLLMPYVPTGRFIEALSTIESEPSAQGKKPRDWKKSTCIFAHQEIKNCKMGAIISTEGDNWNLNWPMLISGHIHERQYVQKNVLYPGSAINHAFGNDNQGLSIFSFTDNKILSETKIDIGLAKKSIIYKNINTLDTIQLQTLTKHNKLSLEGEFKDIAAFKKSKTYKELIDKQIKIVFRKIDETKLKTNLNVEEQVVPQITPFGNILLNLISEEIDEELKKDFQYIKNI